MIHVMEYFQIVFDAESRTVFTQGLRLYVIEHCKFSFEVHSRHIK